MGIVSPALAQWGDYDDVPRRRAPDYYRDDGGYGGGGRQTGRRYAPQPQEAPRQFFWPWEDRPQQAQPAPVPSARPTRPRSAPPPSTYSDDRRAPASPAARRPRPAPAVAAQPKPTAPKVEPTTRLAVFGDSLASYLGRGLDDVFEDNADVEVVDRSKADSGLVRKDVVDWPKVAEEYLKTGPKPAYALVMLGANDRQPIREGDQTVEVLSERWRDIYRDRVDALVKVFADRKIPLIWVGTPPMRSDSLTKDLTTLNDIYRERVARAGGTYVDIWPGFVDERNRYAATGPDLEGQPAKLRTADGVHFTGAGSRKVAHFADVELKRMMGAGTPLSEQPAAAIATTPSGPALNADPPKLDDTAAIDKLITAMLPSLPEPPGIPALPVKPAAGPVVPLSRAEISPGGALMNGRPREPDASGTVERTLQRGAAPPPQPGRADDFRWPPS
ncbi:MULTISPECIES: SGNH family hydrolase [unclassified Methylobacterium]|uniref:SGNH/GDSL hydrolase family protein n=1 Tax=unclassified Methylobacterium TaxID=2615210 RepID=UPI001FCE2210|nr:MULTISPECIES: SGNH family hydrolase [unclassified Methylobacterium]